MKNKFYIGTRENFVFISRKDIEYDFTLIFEGFDDNSAVFKCNVRKIVKGFEEFNYDCNIRLNCLNRYRLFDKDGPIVVAHRDSYNECHIHFSEEV